MNEKKDLKIYRNLYQYGAERLKEAGILEYQLDARLLLEAVCQTDRNTLLVYPETEVSDEKIDIYVNYIKKREQRVPLQHILENQNFMGLDFYVNQNVLIPRQDTEILVEEALKNLHDGMQILDLCTGSGCILISLLHYSNDCKGIGADISEKALEVACKNAECILGKPGKKKDYQFLQGDLFEALQKIEELQTKEFQTKELHSDGESISTIKFDMVVSNPPYIKTAEIEKLEPEVKTFEPMNALDGMADGLYFYRKITEKIGNYLVRNGMLYFEIGYDQGEDVKKIMEEAGFKEVVVQKDYAGLDRVVYGTYLP